MKKLRKGEIASLGEGYWGDGQGVYLRVYPSGTRTWVFRYRDRNSNSRKETLGEYPQMTLAQAREVCSQTRHMLPKTRSGAGACFLCGVFLSKLRERHRNCVNVI